MKDHLPECLKFRNVIEILHPVITPADSSKDIGGRLFNQGSVSTTQPNTISQPSDVYSDPFFDCMLDDNNVSPYSHSNDFYSSSFNSSDNDSIDITKLSKAFTKSDYEYEKDILLRNRLQSHIIPDVDFIPFSYIDVEVQDDNTTQPTHYVFAIILSKKSTYIGWFYSISPVSGKGYSFNSDGSYFHGELLNDKKNGFGEFYYDNGSHFDGFWKDNTKQGKGRFYFNKDLYYSGEWKNNKMIDCELKYSASVCNDIESVFSFITTRNDFIFFKQAQISGVI